MIMYFIYRLWLHADGTRRFQLLDNWKDLIVGAWSSRFIILMFLLNAFEASYSFFLGAAPLPAGMIGGITAALSILTYGARLILQKKLSKGQSDASG